MNISSSSLVLVLISTGDLGTEKRYQQFLRLWIEEPEIAEVVLGLFTFNRLWKIFVKSYTRIYFFDHNLLLLFIVEGLKCIMWIYCMCIVWIGIAWYNTWSSRYPFWIRSSISFRDLKILKSESQLKGQCSTWMSVSRLNISHPGFHVSMFSKFPCFNVLKFLTHES